MRASQVLQKCLRDSLEPMDALREAVLLHSVEALMAGQRLTLTDVARAWPGAERVKAPLKAFDRLLSNQIPQGQSALSLFSSLGANRSPWISAFAGMTNKQGAFAFSRWESFWPRPSSEKRCLRNGVSEKRCQRHF